MFPSKTILLFSFLTVAALWSDLYSQTITNPRTPAEFEEVKGVVIRWDEKEYYQIFFNVQTQGWTSYWTGRYQGTMNTQAAIVREALNEGIEVYVIDDTSHTSKYGGYLYSDYHVADTLTALGISSPRLHVIPYVALDDNIWKVWIRDWGQYNVYKNGVDSISIVGRDLDSTIGRYLQKPFITSNVMDGGNFMVDGHGRLICDAFQTNINQVLFGINDLVTVANYKIHIDYYMKLIDEETFIVNEVPASNHNPSIDTFFGDSTALEGAIATMRQKTSCFGRQYKFVRIRNAPTYSQGGLTYITSEAGYANSLLLNRTVLVPMYDNPATDTIAINIYKKIMPGYRIVGIQSKYNAARQGAIHCLTKELSVDDPIFIAHARLPDTTENNQSQYQIKAYIKTQPGVSHAEVNWSTNPQGGFQTIPMIQTVNDTFVAYLPGQPTGSVLSYYISATANGGKQVVKPIVAPTGYYSTFLRATTQLAAPNLIGWTGQSSSPMFYWSSSIGATHYWLQVALDQNFVNVVYEYPTVTDTFQTVGQLSPGTRYYSRVAATDTIGTSGWSNLVYIDVGCPTFAPGILRDDFNRADGQLSGTNKWSQLLNDPGGGSINVVSNGIQATGATYTSTGVVWDTLMGSASEASLKVIQKSGDFNNSSLFIYARMNNKDYNTGTGYRLRYWEQSGADLIEIHRVGPGYANFTLLASTTREIIPGDVITLRVLCDNQTMVAMVNGIQLLSTTDATYMPSQWYFAFRSYVFPTPVRFDDFVVSSQQAGPPTPPGVPTLLTPPDTATNQSTTPTLRWSGSAGATLYRLQVSSDSLFGATMLDDSTLTTTSRQVGPLSRMTTYYWRVNARNDAGASSFSSARYFTTIPDGDTAQVYAYAVSGGWNLVSLPLVVQDYRKTVLFPTANSNLFGFNGAYYSVDTCKHGLGYWLKFQSSEIIQITGTPIHAETLDVQSGWNLIGSVGAAIHVNAIITIPPAMVTSSVFGFNGAYYPTDSIRPTQGYWIKISSGGKLILSSSGGPSSKSRVRIVPTSELPPLAPGAPVIEWRQVPHTYSLEQNHPNPFNPTTQITYAVPNLSDVTLRVYDMLGREVSVLVNEKKDAGEYTVQWRGDGVPSGVYIYRMVTGGFVEIRKMLLMK